MAAITFGHAGLARLDRELQELQRVLALLRLHLETGAARPAPVARSEDEDFHLRAYT